MGCAGPSVNATSRFPEIMRPLSLLFMDITSASLAASLDSTNLRLDAQDADIISLCEEAAKERFACVMIYPASVPLAAQVLQGTGTRIGTVIGFPSGRFATAAKETEIIETGKAGAHEVDIVINYSALREGRTQEVLAELLTLTKRAHQQGQLIKVITENCFLNQEQMLTALRLCEEAGCDFIKTSTGFGTSGAKLEQIQLWAANRKTGIKLKAAGGIKTLNDASVMIKAGAARLGTSNAGAIMAEFRGQAPSAAKAGY